MIGKRGMDFGFAFGPPYLRYYGLIADAIIASLTLVEPI
jgi:hypothetical protein